MIYDIRYQGAISDNFLPVARLYLFLIPEKYNQ